MLVTWPLAAAMGCSIRRNGCLHGRWRIRRFGRPLGLGRSITYPRRCQRQFPKAQCTTVPPLGKTWRGRLWKASNILEGDGACQLLPRKDTPIIQADEHLDIGRHHCLPRTSEAAEGREDENSTSNNLVSEDIVTGLTTPTLRHITVVCQNSTRTRRLKNRAILLTDLFT
jgi:hypothetical protein